MVDQTTMAKQVLVLRLISKYRTLGFFAADLDPLKRHEAKYLTDLDFRTYGFTDADLDTEFDVGSFKGGQARMRLRDIHAALRETYTRTIGLEYMYISDTPVKRYVQERVEPTRARGSFTVEERRHILERLTAAETLERYLHTKYVGQKRFSGEGGDTMTPMLDRLIQRAGAAGVQEIVMGMAHRGRLNVLVNVLGKMPADLFSEFEGKAEQELPAGDVKYHQGFSSDIATAGGTAHVTLAFNPSHLEIVNPVVEGSVRARQHRRGDRMGDQVLPVVIHGDAAIAGQGIVRVLSYQVARPLADGKLQLILEGFAPPPVPVNIVQLPGVTNRLAASFTDFAANGLRPCLSSRAQTGPAARTPPPAKAPRRRSRT